MPMTSFSQPGQFRTALAAVVALVFCAAASADDPTGEQIFKQKCQYCHGPTGEGTKRYPERLVGERSVAELSKVIAKTMPDNDPGSLSTEEAARVASYVHDAFYSPAAQARNKPARIELARLTVRQYRNAVADPVGSFRPATPHVGRSTPPSRRNTPSTAASAPPTAPWSGLTRR